VNVQKVTQAMNMLLEEVGAIRMQRDDTLYGKHQERDKLSRQEFLLLDAAESVRKALGVR
jgi:hypothetical protein